MNHLINYLSFHFYAAALAAARAGDLAPAPRRRREARTLLSEVLQASSVERMAALEDVGFFSYLALTNRARLGQRRRRRRSGNDGPNVEELIIFKYNMKQPPSTSRSTSGTCPK